MNRLPSLATSSLAVGAAVLLLGGATAVGASVPPVEFEERIDSPTSSPYGPGPGAQTLVVEDLDGDGILDVVATDFATTTPRALLGEGDGSFAAPVPLPASGGVLSIAAGEFDGDGIVDLVGHSEYSLVRWSGNGDGTFTLTQTIYGPGNAQPAVAVADVNGDGLDDVVSPSPQGIKTHLGTGSGLVGGPTSTAYGLISDVAFGDFDGDGVVDVVIADATPFVQRARVLLGAGDGSFASAGSSAVGFGPEAVSVGDLDGDGFDDVVTSDSFSLLGSTRFSISVLLSDGSGGFRSRVTHPVGLGPVSGAVGDLNGDGTLDVAISTVGDASVSLFTNDGTGALSSAGAASVVSFPQTPVIVDVDDDGATDLVVAGRDAVSVLRGT